MGFCRRTSSGPLLALVFALASTPAAIASPESASPESAFPRAASGVTLSPAGWAALRAHAGPNPARYFATENPGRFVALVPKSAISVIWQASTREAGYRFRLWRGPSAEAMSLVGEMPARLGQATYRLTDLPIAEAQLYRLELAAPDGRTFVLRQAWLIGAGDVDFGFPAARHAEGPATWAALPYAAVAIDAGAGSAPAAGECRSEGSQFQRTPEVPPPEPAHAVLNRPEECSA